MIVGAVRTPIGKGKPGGALSGVHPVDLLAHTLKALIERIGIDPELVDDVFGGCVDQVGEQAIDTTRNAWQAASLSESVPAVTVDPPGAYDLMVACGVVPQSISAELIAAKWGLSRERLDEFSAESHRRAAAARMSSGPPCAASFGRKPVFRCPAAGTYGPHMPPRATIGCQLWVRATPYRSPQTAQQTVAGRQAADGAGCGQRVSLKASTPVKAAVRSHRSRPVVALRAAREALLT